MSWRRSSISESESQLIIFASKISVESRNRKHRLIWQRIKEIATDLWKRYLTIERIFSYVWAPRINHKFTDDLSTSASALEILYSKWTHISNHEKTI
jgi:hypothetical protein